MDEAILEARLIAIVPEQRRRLAARPEKTI
jgi:hypothetical protein